MTRGDRALIASLLALAAALFVLSLIGKRPGAEAVITVDGRECAVLPLDEDAVYEAVSANGRNIIRVSDGRVFVEEASCANQNCVEHRAISETGEAIVCLPNRVTAELYTAEEIRRMISEAGNTSE